MIKYIRLSGKQTWLWSFILKILNMTLNKGFVVFLKQKLKVYLAEWFETALRELKKKQP